MKLNGIDFNAPWVAAKELEEWLKHALYKYFTKEPLPRREQMLREVHGLCQKECGIEPPVKKEDPDGDAPEEPIAAPKPKAKKGAK